MCVRLSVDVWECMTSLYFTDSCSQLTPWFAQNPCDAFGGTVTKRLVVTHIFIITSQGVGEVVLNESGKCACISNINRAGAIRGPTRNNSPKSQSIIVFHAL